MTGIDPERLHDLAVMLAADRHRELLGVRLGDLQARLLNGTPLAAAIESLQRIASDLEQLAAEEDAVRVAMTTCATPAEERRARRAEWVAAFAEHDDLQRRVAEAWPIVDEHAA